MHLSQKMSTLLNMSRCEHEYKASTHKPLKVFEDIDNKSVHYRVVPAHRNWHIENAGWNWASFFTEGLETRWQ